MAVRIPTLTPLQYFWVALVALVSLVVIVLSGSAVRLTGSGLGCPDWPRCFGSTLPPAEYHAVIEYGNRIFTGFVGLAVIAASVLAFRRRPFRWHLAALGALLPLGVIAQATLGALVVRHHLMPELVMGHFILSMLLLDAAFALVWLSRYESGERRRSGDRLGVWAARGLVPLGQITIVLGTMSTGSGPHAGNFEGQLVQRFDFRGDGTLSWMIERHSALAAIFGLAAIGVWLLLRRDGGDRRALRPLSVLIGLLALQGAVGAAQWSLELPAGLVWLHVGLATLTWVSVLWTVATAGLLEPRRERARSRSAQLLRARTGPAAASRGRGRRARAAGP